VGSGANASLTAMRSPRRVLLYGLGVWIGLVVVSLVLLPFEDANNALYESVKSSALVAIALGFTIRYMRRVRLFLSDFDHAAVGCSVWW